MCSMYLHADLDAFYASVEQRDNPRLRGKPVIVGGGVVLAASYEAKRRGVKTAMGGRAARAVCPDAIVVPPRMDAYTTASKAVFSIFRETSPWVEGLSIDEAFLDVSGLRRLSGSPEQIAAHLRDRVRDEVGLAITVGVANTKFLAKVASGVGKPDGLLLVEPGYELAFLHPLTVERLWGVGPVTARKLNDRGLTTVAQVAQLDVGVLVGLLGKGQGQHLHALAHNLDPRPIRVGHRRGSIGSQRALGRMNPSRDESQVMLIGLVDRITRRMRRAERVGRTVVLRMRYDDFTKGTRSHTLDEATSETAPILASTRMLLNRAWPMLDERGLTMIGVSVTNLSNANAVQLTLPLGPRARPSVDSAFDEIRDKFGTNSLKRATHLGESQHSIMPMLPD
ncbi:MAG: DNA polymerase IV [Actinomycetia bacterium]|nr:DNA polymerase IV [Actinomycetes bacterium]MCP4960013.1 DNA polymerase IV [Actinomycetes bacterium]